MENSMKSLLLNWYVNLPLRRIYVLYDADEIVVEQLHPREAFAETIAYAYAVGLLGPAAMTLTHFQQHVAYT